MCMTTAETIKTHGEATQKVIDAVKESPGTYEETIENAVGDYLKWYELHEIEAMYPQIFKE